MGVTRAESVKSSQEPRERGEFGVKCSPCYYCILVDGRSVQLKTPRPKLVLAKGG